VSYEDLIGLVDLGVPSNGSRETIAVSPDQKMVAIETRRADLTTNTVQIRWLFVHLDQSAEPIDGGDGGEPIFAYITQGINVGYSPPQVPQWSQDSQWIFYRSQQHGEVQLWRSSSDGKRREVLSAGRGDVKSFHVADDGRRVFIIKGLRRGALPQAISEEAQRGFLYDNRFSPLYSKLPLVDAAAAAADDRMMTLDLEAQTERPSTAAERVEYSNLTSVAEDQSAESPWPKRASRSGAVARIVDLRNPAVVGLNPPRTLVVADSGKTFVCEVAVCTGTFEGIWITSDGRTVFFTRRLDNPVTGTLVLLKWIVGQRAPTELLRTRDVLQSCTLVNDSELVCGRESSTTPMVLETIDLRTGAARTLLDPNPRLHRLAQGQVQPLDWKDANGVEGHGYLVTPIGYQRGKRYPLVIVQYRAKGFLRGGVGDEHPIPVLAAKGFVVLSFDRPDDAESEASSATYEESNRKSWTQFHDRKRVVSVLLAGIDLLDRRGIVDPRRVGLTGLSDGAETAAFALVQHPDRFAAVSTSQTFWNPISYYLAGPTLIPIWQEQGFNNPADPSSSDHWRGISVALNARLISAPVLIHVSELELLPETEMFTALQELGKPVEMYVFPDEYHIKSQPQHRFNIYRRNVQWMQFWLQGVEDSNPVDPQQYDRWRKMRGVQGPSGASGR
jgi:dipeptidyl aminopeptidase/acylaminoacyl peptidase